MHRSAASICEQAVAHAAPAMPQCSCVMNRQSSTKLMPGVSRMIAALEAETGFSLLHREHGGVRPTAACERLLPAIRALLKAGENCAQLSAQIRGADVGTVTIGTAYCAFYTPQKVEIGIACLDGLSPAAETFFEFLRPQISSLA